MAQITGVDDMQCMLDESCMLDGVQLDDLIGSGSYAKVYKGEWKGIQVAVKQLHEIFSETGEQEKEGLTRTFYKELGMNMKLRHPNIIQFLGVAKEVAHCPEGDDGSRPAVQRGRRLYEDFPVMVMELMHCTVDKRLAEYRDIGTLMPFSATVDIATDVAAALVYLHGKEPPIAHRDLAPKNVLLSSSGTAKLCDLGVAKWVNSSLKHTMGPGTLPYMPPEVRISTSYSPVAVDVYSFGVTLLEMCCGLEPKPKEFAQMTSPDGSYQLVPERTRRSVSFVALPPSHPLESTIEQCLQTNAVKRPTAMQLLTALQGGKETSDYLESKQTFQNKSCSVCERKDEELGYLQEQLEEQQKELLRLFEANKTLENFRDEQLRMLKFKLQMAAKEGEKYQLQIQEMQEELEEQVQMNLQLEMTNDRANDINHLLKQKVEMDSHLCHVSQLQPRDRKLLEKSTSVRCFSEQRPIPKPRKRKESVPVTSRSIECLDNITEDPVVLPRPQSLYHSPTISASTSSITGLKMEPAEEGGPTYLQLDAEAMAMAQKKDSVRISASKPQKSHSLLRNSKKQCSTSHEDTEDPVYITIPVSGPPTPPPRDQEFKFSRISQHAISLHSPLARPNQLSVIDERDESMKSPGGAMTPWNHRTTQSVRSPRRPEPHTLEPPRPIFGRQNSRGDVLISEVVSTVKSKNSRYLSAKKGELVKVTISVIDKKFCIAVKTNGESGTIRRKNLEQIKPVEIPYDPTNPALSSRKGVFNHIALCSSHNNTWVSPVESNRVIIMPSSIHSGDVGLLVKMTDYLLCCTDSDKESHFEIDLREQRLLKLTGYVLQCHHEEYNGAPLHWKLEGSHNGHSWSHLSEESGYYFEKKFTNYFSVTNPMPCRYFKLTQLGKNSEDNYRFCLSGVEFYGSLYSSVVEERYTCRV